MDVKRFVCMNIVTWFGVSEFIISDNGLQFDSKAFRWYCSELGITNRYSTPSSPQGNGQAKATNKSIVNGLKRRLDVKGTVDGRASERVMGIQDHSMTFY